MISVPSRTEILDDVIAVLERDLGVQSSTAINEDTRFFADLGLASIDAVVLSERLQEHYGRPLPFNDLMAEIGRKTRSRPLDRRAGRISGGESVSELVTYQSIRDISHAQDPREWTELSLPAGGIGPGRDPDPRRHRRPVDLVPVPGDGRARPARSG